MDLLSVKHRGLRRFIEKDDASGIEQALVNRIRNVLAALLTAESVDAIAGPPGWRIHQLVGDRENVVSISVSGNWRLTFSIVGGKIIDLDLEDYH